MNTTTANITDENIFVAPTTTTSGAPPSKIPSSKLHPRKPIPTITKKHLSSSTSSSTTTSKRPPTAIPLPISKNTRKRALGDITDAGARNANNINIINNDNNNNNNKSSKSLLSASITTTTKSTIAEPRRASGRLAAKRAAAAAAASKRPFINTTNTTTTTTTTTTNIPNNSTKSNQNVNICKTISINEHNNNNNNNNNINNNDSLHNSNSNVITNTATSQQSGTSAVTARLANTVINTATLKKKDTTQQQQQPHVKKKPLSNRNANINNTITTTSASAKLKIEQKQQQSVVASNCIPNASQPKQEEQPLPSIRLPAEIDMHDDPCFDSSMDGVRDIDAADHGDTLHVSQFARVIHDTLRCRETEFVPCSNVLPVGTHINERMRAVLVDWLVDVHAKHRLRSETLHLCINLLDRVLHDHSYGRSITRRTLQLIGMVCLWIASKFEDLYPPEVSDLVYVCDGAYTRADVISAEAKLLRALSFDVNVPTVLPFLRRTIKAAAHDMTEEDACMARYITEIAMLHNHTRCMRPSLIAAVACKIAKANLKWDNHMQFHTGWSEQQVEQGIHAIKLVCKDEVKLRYTVEMNFFTSSSNATNNHANGHNGNGNGNGSGAAAKLTALKRKFDTPRYLNVSSKLPLLVKRQGWI